MKEVNKAKNGKIEYVDPAMLKSGPRAYSEAIFGKVIHNTPDVQDFTLKIGRYKKNTKTPEISEPKSELTLDNEEFCNLIEYLEANYGPLKLGVGKYLEIQQSSALSILKQIQTLKIPDEKQALDLIESGLLTDNIQLAITSIKRKKAITEFEQNLLYDYSESFWQEWFSKNKWILGSEYIEILDERMIDASNIADYLMKAFDGFLDVVEIKKPNGMNFWLNAKDHDNYVPSTYLVKAITQCQNYLYEIERESNSSKFLEKTKGTKIIKPRCLLIFGRSNNWDKEQCEAYRVLNASLNQITILTYDHLIARAKNVLGIENKFEEIVDLPF